MNSKKKAEAAKVLYILVSLFRDWPMIKKLNIVLALKTEGEPPVNIAKDQMANK